MSGFRSLARHFLEAYGRDKPPPDHDKGKQRLDVVIGSSGGGLSHGVIVGDIS
jgi:hypothetical protein